MKEEGGEEEQEGGIIHNILFCKPMALYSHTNRWVWLVYMWVWPTYLMTST